MLTSLIIGYLYILARADSPSSSFDIDPWLATTFVNALEQFNKLQLGDTLSVTSEFDNVIIIQFNLLPLIVTFCIKPQANIGLIYALFPQLLSRLQPIRNKLLSDFN
uniref:Uncharacterized protein n=1 Tax=Spongospora subterranea TaxID=70186 RepID=A0A0H5QI04_9EUKA|eukprot:CRZ01685.1 hypothetical protein [Spongospora subterranea]